MRRSVKKCGKLHMLKEISAKIAQGDGPMIKDFPNIIWCS